MIELPSLPDKGPWKDLPGIPSFPSEAQNRLWAAIASAQSKARDQLEVIVDSAIRQGKLFSKLTSEEKILPLILRYAESLFTTYAKEVCVSEEAPETCRRLLRQTLSWSVAFKIAPEQTNYDDEEFYSGNLDGIEGDWNKIVSGVLEGLDYGELNISLGPLVRRVRYSFLRPVLRPASQVKILTRIHTALVKRVDVEFAEGMKERDRKTGDRVAEVKKPPRRKIPAKKTNLQLLDDPLADTKKYIREYYSNDYVSQLDLCDRMTAFNRNESKSGWPPKYPMPKGRKFSNDQHDWAKAYREERTSLAPWLTRQKSTA